MNKLNTNQINNKQKNIFDLTFNINQLPTHLIRKILSYYYDHCLSMYNYIEKKNKVFTGYKLKFRWVDLCLVCKFWTEMVMPYLPNTFYLMDSQQKLETYLNLVEYGGTFPRRFLKPTLLRVVKPPTSMKRHPFHINSLGIYINRYQIPHQDDSIIPEVIYQQIFKLSPDLKLLQFQTENDSMSDLFYILKQLNDTVSITLNLLNQLDLTNCYFNIKTFEQLCKFIQNNKTLKILILNQTQFRISQYEEKEFNYNLLLNNNNNKEKEEEIKDISLIGENEDINNLIQYNNSFLNSLKKNQTLEKLKLNSTELFSPNRSILIGGTLLDLIQYIFVESSIKVFELLETSITLDFKQTQLTRYTSSLDRILTPMQKNLEHISFTVRSNDQFLILLENSIRSSKSLKEVNLSGSTFSQLNEISNLLISLQHCDSLLKVNLSNVRFYLDHQPSNNQQVGDIDNNEFIEDNEDLIGNVLNTNAFHSSSSSSTNSILSLNQFQKFSFIYGTQSLVSINLSSTVPIVEDEMITLFENLRYSSQLKELFIRRTGLTSKCLTALTNLIREPASQLELLHVGSNNFGSSISLLLMAFQLSKTLTNIDISSNQLTNNEGLAIAKFIKESSIVRHLNISNSDLKLSALNQLGTALSINKSLVSLDLSNIHLGMLEVTYIIDGLVQHPTISLLNLSNCGSKEMIKSLEETSQLRCNIISTYYN